MSLYTAGLCSHDKCRFLFPLALGLRFCCLFFAAVDHKLPVVSLLSKAAVLCSPLSQLELSMWSGSSYAL